MRRALEAMSHTSIVKKKNCGGSQSSSSWDEWSQSHGGWSEGGGWEQDGGWWEGDRWSGDNSCSASDDGPPPKGTFGSDPLAIEEEPPSPPPGAAFDLLGACSELGTFGAGYEPQKFSILH